MDEEEVIYIAYDGEWKNEQKSDGERKWIWIERNKRIVPVNIDKSIKLHSLVEMLYEKIDIDRGFDLKLSYLSPIPGFRPIVIEDDVFLRSFVTEVFKNRIRSLHVELIKKEEIVTVNDNDVCNEEQSPHGGDDNELCNEQEIHHEGEVNMCDEEERQHGSEDGGEIRDDFDWQFTVDVASNPNCEGVILDEMSPNLKTTASAPTPKGTTTTESSNLDNDDATRTTLAEHGPSTHSFFDGSDLAIGQEFASKFEVQKMLNQIALQGSFEMKVVKSTKTLYVVRCVDSHCSWRLRAAQEPNSTSFSIRTYCNTHTCSITCRKRKHRQASSSMVADMVYDEYKGEKEALAPKTIQTIMQNRGVTISYWKAWKSKQLAYNHPRGTPEASYKLLPSYLYMVEKKNPGSITHFELDEKNKFKYLFLAFGVCIEGFKCMRKVVSIDGAFLETKYKGTLIIATAQDGNYHQYPIAVGVVDSENDASWTWFLTKLRDAIPDEEDLVFISDRHESIIKAVLEVYPKAHHGHCMWHIMQNLKKRFKYEGLFKLFTKTVETYTMAEFQVNYEKMTSRYPRVVDYLPKPIDVEKWARAYFVGARYNVMNTNLSESMNDSLKRAKEYPLIAFLDAIQELVSMWWNNRRTEATSLSNTLMELTPKVEEIIRARFIRAETMVSNQLNSFEFHVKGGGDESVLVNLHEKSCECRVFDVDKLPCAHAIAAIGHNNFKQVYDQCSHYYKLSTWLLAYKGTVYPVPSSKEWNIPENLITIKVLPPDVEIQRGRRKMSGIPSVRERTKFNRRCNICRELGHYKKRCPYNN